MLGIVKRFCSSVVILFWIVTLSFAQNQQDGSALPAGLPDPLVFSNGGKVSSKKQWPKRREELLVLFTREMYGQIPPRPPKMRFQLFDIDRNALGGKATRKQISILLDGTPSGPQMNLLLYLPNGVKHPPVILGLNFSGNHAISSDPGIRISDRWMALAKSSLADLPCFKTHRDAEACRGTNAKQWPLEKILSRGYGLATIYRGDLDPDTKNGYGHSVRAMYPQMQERDDNFSTIGLWAWGLSRAMDYLKTDHDVDSRRVELFGFSRLGKAALWAGATDQRFAAVISNESGAGGAKLFRHGQGENILRLNTVFPYWFCKNFSKYNNQDTDLPFDQHMVLALIAPRPLYVASAVDDHNSDPEGEFLSAKAVSSVYQLLGKTGLPANEWPSVDQPVLGLVSYHVRSGGHDVLEFDWEQYLKFSDMYLKPVKHTY